MDWPAKAMTLYCDKPSRSVEMFVLLCMSRDYGALLRICVYLDVDSLFLRADSKTKSWRGAAERLLSLLK